VSELVPNEAGSGYETPVVLGGVLAAVFFPFIALIAALILQGSESNPVKRGQLRTLAWASGAWLAVQAFFFIVIVIVFASAASGLGN